MNRIRVAARPEPVDIDLARTALIVVDMQNDFGAAGGMFDRAGIDIAPIRAIIPRIGRVLAAARAASLPVLYLKQQHAPDLGDAGGPKGPHFIKHQRMRLLPHRQISKRRRSHILLPLWLLASGFWLLTQII